MTSCAVEGNLKSAITRMIRRVASGLGEARRSNSTESASRMIPESRTATPKTQIRKRAPM